MSPLHILVWAFALLFQITNATALGSWLAAYGPTTAEEWQADSWSTVRFLGGVAVFYFGLATNYFHDDELRNIRRKEMRRMDRVAKEQKKAGKKVSVEKHYQIPEAGLFKYMLYAHYFCEWIEWTGFWIAAGWGCVPARTFVINEVMVMFPRAVRGKWWYQERFGEEKVKGKWAVLPGIY
jgi:3-oxo-5-alpha-steroid 4-dehydrogenase 1